MRLAFSTLGLPGLPVPDLVALARTSGYQGVELRCHPEEPVHPGLGRLERTDVVEEFAKGGIEILTLASYVKVAAPGDDEPVLAELREHLALARDLGAAHVRVFPGARDVPQVESDPTAVRRLAAIAPYAADLGVRVLLETHDSHRTGKDVARILEQVGQPRSTGAIWDLMHPWVGGEEPADTLAALTPYLGYVQVKDISSPDETTPLTLGAGALPLAETLVLLTEAGWDGWLCWEYEKRWYPQAEELSKLLVPGREHLLQLLSYAS